MRHTIDMLESHCWNGKRDAEVYQVVEAAKKMGMTVIPYSTLRPNGELASSIREFAHGSLTLNPETCKIVKISGLEFDGEDEVSYTVTVEF